MNDVCCFSTSDRAAHHVHSLGPGSSAVIPDIDATCIGFPAAGSDSGQNRTRYLRQTQQ